MLLEYSSQIFFKFELNRENATAILVAFTVVVTDLFKLDVYGGNAIIILVLL